MDQRRAIIISAALFALVVVGSVIFLTMTEPRPKVGDLPAEMTETPEPTPDTTEVATASGTVPDETPTPLVVIEQVPEPTPTSAPIPRIASATVTAPTGPATSPLLLALASLLTGALSLGFVIRNS